jgi:hypothetical protein
VAITEHDANITFQTIYVRKTTTNVKENVEPGTK